MALSLGGEEPVCSSTAMLAAMRRIDVEQFQVFSTSGIGAFHARHSLTNQGARGAPGVAK